MRSPSPRTAALLPILLAAHPAAAQVITFETTPAGVAPTDDLPLPIDLPYTLGLIAVTIGVDTDNDGTADAPAIFERIGQSAEDGFVNASLGQWDVALPPFDTQLGTWFLRTATQTTNDFGGLIINYDTPVSGASGEIWDIDARPDGSYEQWRVTAFQGDGSVAAEVISPRGINGPTFLDGEPWLFAFSGDDIRKIQIAFVGTAATAGLAFNNFRAASTIPGPTILTHQPDHNVTNPAGTPTASISWSEPVTIAPTDVTIRNTDDLPVPFTLAGSGTTVTTITFTGDPGGPATPFPVPLVRDVYTITIADTARAVANNAPIDGDNNGITGGDATLTVAASCGADLATPFGLLDLRDVNAFVASFVSGCN